MAADLKPQQLAAGLKPQQIEVHPYSHAGDHSGHLHQLPREDSESQWTNATNHPHYGCRIHILQIDQKAILFKKILIT